MNPMEEDQDQELHKERRKKKHVCKFCSKSFPCGRSLGGHMRSHVINGTDENNKLLLVTASAPATTGSEGACYGLRENPKKTWRLTTTEQDTLLCKDCGKGFPSWKSLFGHMKCHSEKERVPNSSNNNNINTNSFDDDDDQVQDSSWTNNVMDDSQSENEEANTAPNRRKRSKRRRTRYYMAPPPPPSTNSSLSLASEADEMEQEEVALSLMMLSRDVGNWGGLNSVSEYSNSIINNKNYYYSLLHFDDAPSSVRTNNLVSKIEGKKLVVTNNGSSELEEKVTKPVRDKLLVNSDCLNNSKGKKISESFAIETANGEGLNLSKSGSTTHSKYTSIKEKFSDSESKAINPLRDSVNNPQPESEFISKSIHSSSNNNNKRGKFECTTCNKIFHSYQALGGHRASHKKIKGCFASKVNNEGSENSIELEENSKHIKKNSDNNNNELYLVEHEDIVVGTISGFDTESKKGKGHHECPICLKVFPSGQALGGHKRSHMASEGKNCPIQTVVVHESVPEIRDFLDLNLPASSNDEESKNNNSHHVDEVYRPWWVVGGNHKQEALVGLMSN